MVSHKCFNQPNYMLPILQVITPFDLGSHHKEYYGTRNHVFFKTSSQMVHFFVPKYYHFCNYQMNGKYAWTTTQLVTHIDNFGICIISIYTVKNLFISEASNHEARGLFCSINSSFAITKCSNICYSAAKRWFQTV